MNNRILIGAGVDGGNGANFNNLAIIGNGDISGLWANDEKSATFFGAGLTETSDLRLKELIMPLDYGLSYILKLSPVSYYWKDKSNGKESMQVGLIAQDVEKINAEMQIENQIVHKPSDLDEDIMGIEYSKLVVPLIKAVQELNEEIERLKEEIKELKENK